jgi:hypothetical protein
MMRKLIIYVPDLDLLRAAMAELDAPFSKAHQMKNHSMMTVGKKIIVNYSNSGAVLDVRYNKQLKTKTLTNDNSSVSLVAMSDHEVESFVRPFVDSGMMICLGCVDGELYSTNRQPWNNITEQEWLLVYQAWPEGLIADEDGEFPVFFGDVAI